MEIQLNTSKFFIFLGGMVAFMSILATKEALAKEGVPEELIEKLHLDIMETYDKISLYNYKR